MGEKRDWPDTVIRTDTCRMLCQPVPVPSNRCAGRTAITPNNARDSRPDSFRHARGQWPHLRRKRMSHTHNGVVFWTGTLSELCCPEFMNNVTDGSVQIQYTSRSDADKDSRPNPSL